MKPSTTSYTEYLAENLDRTIAYSEYLAENISYYMENNQYISKDTLSERRAKINRLNDIK